MILKSLLIIISLFITGIAAGQQYTYQWHLGYNCCPPPLSEGTIIDFASGAPVINYISRPMSFRQTNASINDSSGNLLFYTNGVFIANSLHDTMSNGEGLNPGIYTSNWSTTGLKIPQGDIIIPDPGDPTKYYLFHETADYFPGNLQVARLYKSIIDMSLDGGLGAVILKNDTLLNDTLVNGELTAVKHGNGRDWWLLAHKWYSDEYVKFLITPSGISGPYIQNIGVINGVGSTGQVCFSQSGNKFAKTNIEVGLEIYDFDRCTGLFSNPVSIILNDSSGARGVAFSPNGRYLYCSSTFYLYQFDLNNPNFAMEWDTVGVYDGFTDPIPPFYTYFYLAQLAPDGKININSSNGMMYLHSINSPDSAGTACNFLQHNVQLPYYNASTIPNHPNYNLGRLVQSSCDSLTWGYEINSAEISINSFPNPARDVISFTYSPVESPGELIIYDIHGKLIYKETVAPWSQFKEIDISQLVEGLYLIKINWGNVSSSSKVIKSD